MKNKKAQSGTLVIIGFVFLAVMVFVFAAMILGSIKDLEEEIMNNSDTFNSKGNTTDEVFGTPQEGDTPREMWDKMDVDKDISPPGLSG